jgi:hypothetical protein
LIVVVEEDFVELDDAVLALVFLHKARLASMPPFGKERGA